MYTRTISDGFQEAARLLSECGASSALLLERISREVIDCFERGNKLLLCGNGGSASQAQHIAAELVNKLASYRAALPALSLTTDTSAITSIGNDLDFSEIFARQVEAVGRQGDLLWGLSTSGSSQNVIRAVTAAKKAGMKTVCFTGEAGSELARIADISLTVSSKNTARIQEVHLCCGHAVCECVEMHFLDREHPGNASA